MRSLSPHFFNDLQKGVLSSLLNYIKSDYTLDLQIREDYINVYYRGGNILRVSLDVKQGYIYFFEHKYIKAATPAIVKSINDQQTNKDWQNYFPMAKQAMDFYFTENSKLEREYQQLVVRENNYSTLANGTDYFIVDIEYDNHAGARFDLVAVEWPSHASHRKLAKNFKPKIVVIEMKYGDKALSGDAGMLKHYADFKQFISDSVTLNNFKDEMCRIFEQKRELGLIPCLSANKNSNTVTEFDSNVEIAFLIANHDPESKKLNKELSTLANCQVKFIVSNFMGYGIYNHSIYDLQQFKLIYKAQLP
jgi:hypothetical protein